MPYCDGRYVDLLNSAIGGNGDWSYTEDNLMVKLSEYDDLFKQAGYALKIDWILVAAHAYIESTWNPKAVSNAKTPATGLYQFKPKTWRYSAAPKGYEDEKYRLNASKATEGYIKYMKYQEGRLNPATFQDKILLTLQAYHDGHAHCTTWIDFIKTHRAGSEANNYVPKILKKYAEMGGRVPSIYWPYINALG